jgi:hypothetical protein
VQFFRRATNFFDPGWPKFLLHASFSRVADEANACLTMRLILAGFFAHFNQTCVSSPFISPASHLNRHVCSSMKEESLAIGSRAMVVALVTDHRQHHRRP